MFVVRYRKFFYALSATIMAVALLSIALFGLRPGIEFAGGSLTDVRYESDQPTKEIIEQGLNSLPLGRYTLRATDGGYLLRTRELTETERTATLEALSSHGAYELHVVQQSTIGPTLGAELRNKALVSLVLVIIAIVLYIAYTFRMVSEPVASWKYGLLAIVALFHDILIPAGLFAVLGQYLGVEVDVLFVVALLTVLGFSVNDTIVVFDRVRENLRINKELKRKEDFDLTVGKSLQQTYGRSINTSLTVLFVLLMLFFLGGTATQDFALALIAGVVAGSYSSIFLATPLLLTLQRWGEKRRREKASRAASAA